MYMRPSTSDGRDIRPLGLSQVRRVWKEWTSEGPLGTAMQDASKGHIPYKHSLRQTTPLMYHLDLVLSGQGFTGKIGCTWRIAKQTQIFIRCVQPAGTGYHFYPGKYSDVSLKKASFIGVSVFNEGRYTYAFNCLNIKHKSQQTLRSE